MANRRIFSLDVVDTDMFLEMPASSQNLYFHLGMRADDDGFVSSPKKITKLVNCGNDDLNVLISRGYIIPFNEGIIVIRHWRQNNYIQTDRYKRTIYQQQMAGLTVNNGVYEADACIQPVSKMEAQDSIGKDSIGKDRLESDLCPEPVHPSPDPSGILLPLIDGTDYDVPLSKIGKWSTAYPAVDVRQQLQRMIAWLDANPTRRKTRRGIDRFINTWLSREQDRGGTLRNGTPSQQSEPTQQGRDFYAEHAEMYGKYLSNRESSPDDPFQ